MYKNGKTDDALQAYDDAIAVSKSPVDKEGAWYNKGVALQNNKKLPECIEAYKNALKLNPADEDARLNLQKALQQQKKEQQPKEKKDQKKKEDQKQQQKDQQPKLQPSKMTKKKQKKN